jgi:predicted regulator of Ras-like GTPase activity (Roadblock/LC7/MglB family)
MAGSGRSSESDRRRPPATPPSRARVFREVVAGLSGVANVRGGLLVTPDGLVIVADLPPGAPVEALAALGATLGRELEAGSVRLGRGAFRMALFAGESGTLFVCGGRPGFLLVLGDRSVDVASVRTALARAIERLR